MKKRNLKKPIISALEQRILFDGAAVATAVDVLDNSSFSSNVSSSSTSNNDATSNSAENSVHEVQAVQGFERPRKEVAFVDVTVKDYQTLVDGVGEGTEVYLVSSLDEIKTTLSSQKNIDAIHILSHGNTGEISVGKDVLNSDTLDNNAQLLETMKNSLSENGDILLYGCNVSSDGRGQEFINELATLTQADVAASDDTTGNSALGGDWELEKNSGSIETDNFEIVDYDGKLVTTTMFDFSTESITGSGTKDSFIIRDSSTHYALKFTTADTSADPWAVFQSLNDGSAGLNTTYAGNYLYISNLSAVGAKITVTADMNNDGVFGDTFKINSFNFSDASFGGGNYVIKPNGIATNQETISVSGLPEDITSFIPTTSSNFDGITSLEIQFSSLASGIIIDNLEIDLPTAGDTSPPTFDVTPATSNVTGTTVDLNASLDEAGKIYYVVVADGADAPSIAQIKAGQDSTGASALKSGNSDVTATLFTGTYNITGLSANTAYDIYVVGQDDKGTPNVMTTAAKVDVTTAIASTAVGFTGDSGNTNSPNATVANGSQSSISITNTATNDTLNISITGTNYYQDTATTFLDLGITPLSGGTGMLFYADINDSYTNSITFTIQGNKVFDFNKILLQEINDETDTFTFTPNGDVSKRVTFSFNNAETKLIDLSSNTNFDGITSLTISTLDNQFQASFDNIEVENIRSASDTTAPTFDVAPATSNVTATTVDLSASLDEAGKIYYVVVADGATAPTVTQIKAGQDSTGASALKSGNSDVTATLFTGTYNITGLSANTAYDIYVVGQDDEGTPNVMATATKVDVTTAAPTGIFTKITDPFPDIQYDVRITFGDFDNDGDIDALSQSSNVIGQGYVFTRANGDGTYTNFSQVGTSIPNSPFSNVDLSGLRGTGGFYGTNAISLDYDSDGDIDIISRSGSIAGGANFILRNDNGVFTRISDPFPDIQYDERIEFADFDGDGDIDALAQESNTVGQGYIYMQRNADGTYTRFDQSGTSIPNTPFSSADLTGMNGLNFFAVDYDNDGDRDIINRSGSVAGGENFILRNDGGTFVKVADVFADTQYDLRMTFGDFDNDGDIDALQQESNVVGQGYIYMQRNADGTYTRFDQIGTTIPNTPFSSVDFTGLNGTTFYTIDTDSDGDLDIISRSGSVSGGANFIFQANDSPPTVVSITPSDNGTNVALDSNIVINFSENVTAGVGNIYIKKVSDGSIVETISANSGNVSINGTQVTINPTSNLSSSTDYYLAFDLNAFLDSDQKGFGFLDEFVRVAYDSSAYFNFRTVDIDTTAPTFDVTPAPSNVTATTVDLSASLNEAGKIYYVVVADGATAPTIAQIKAGQDSSGASALKSGNSDVTTTPFTGTYNITGLSANTAYDIYVVGQDDEGTPNVMASATKVDVTTAELPPVFSSSSTTNFAENTTGTVYDAELSSSTGTVTYTLSGTDSGKFDINSTTGILTFKSAPDYETPTDNGTNNVYNVIIRATDNNGYTEQNVAINVTAVNEAPVITSSATVAIDENIGAGQVVYTVTSTDVDASATVTYSLSGTDASLFTIDSTSGEVTLIANPNFENKSSYSFNVIATDNGTLTDTQAVTLAINNVNEAPVITSAETATAINENSGAGQVVYTVTSTDVDASATVTYSLGGTDASLFTINSTTGAVTLTANPNFENKSSYSFNVIATDNGTLTDTQAVTLAINNVNEAPVITSAETATAIDENSGAGQVVYTVTSTDVDASATVTYSLGGTDAELFTIDSSTGAVTLIANPNFENKSSYSFNVIATDNGTLTDTQAVTLAINNVNEAPVITSAGTATAINENSGAGQVVYTVTSTDVDASATVTYSLGGTDAELFTIDSSTGAVTLTANPNFENKSSYSFDVIATDNGTLTDTKAVTLAINNVNEAPVITSAGTATAINENSGAGQVVYTVTSTDVDASATVSYSLSGTDASLFTINSTTGAVTLTANPNFENKSSYSFNVIATDNGTLTDTQAVTLAINNVNEAPVITSAETATAINENSGAGQVVYTVTSTDVDASATVTYSLGGTDAELFTIDSSTGAVTLTANPNFENKSSYSFDVIATDNGTLTDTKAVTLAINNVNEAPVITSAGTATAINENSGAGQVVYTVTSTDVDASATVSYSLSGTDASLFTINSTTGAVTLTANPNFENKSSYSFNVIATDNGTLTDTQAVTLAINNVNEVPVITSSATVAIDENSGAGQVVYTVTSTDVDASATVTYSLSGTDASLFTIDSTSGEVTLIANPNFENKSSYSFDVIATDNGTLTDTQAVTLSINDVNEAPVITSAETATAINENSGAGQVVYTVTSTDVDASATVTYSLSGTDAELFTINSTTGAVTLTANPNFENKSSYSFNVIATDNGTLTDTQAVTLAINNVNEAPVITSAETATAINENSGAGQVVYTVTSTDVDASATVTYSLGGTDASLFTINSTTGAVTLTANPNFENKSSYSFNVIATDNGTLTDTQAVTLAINNVNEAPVITSAETATAIDENSGAGKVVYTVTSTDVDASATVTYSLGGTDAELFTIDSSTGAVTLIANPNFETKSSYSFNVIATDNGTLTDTKAVTLAINNVNEAPVITSAATATAIDENSGAGQVVYTVTSTDVDVSATVTYSLSGTDASLFTIDSTTGAVTLTANPNFETKSSYSFNVIATDNGTLTDTKAVTLAINNVNEAPVITSAETATAINENSGAGQVVYTVTSTDVDASATVTYSLSGTDASLFTIDSTTGAVTLTANPNFETKSSYSFNVIATDNGTLTDTQAVTLAINNVNEAPVITSAGTATAINENSGAGQVVYTVTSTDVDASATVTYSLGGTDAELFTIDSSTGAVTLTANPNFENKSSYSFDVIATDNGTLTDTQAVTLSINDVNEAPVGSLTIVGIITQGETLTVTNNITDDEGLGTLSYQWYADGVLINGAVNTTYTLTQNDVNKEITVIASYEDGLGANETVTSSSTSSVENVNDVPTVSSKNINIQLSFGDNYIKDISGLFNDIDFNNTFIYEAINLPDGLTINPSTGIISGKVNQSGEFIITIKVTDNGTPALSISRTYNMFVVAPAQPEVKVTAPLSPIPSNNTPTGNTSDIGVNTFADTLSLGTINNSLGDGVADSIGEGYVNSNNAPTQENSNQNNSDNSGQNEQTGQSNRNYIEADASLNVGINGQISFDRATLDSFSIVGITIENMSIENNKLEIRVVDTSISQNFIVTQTDGSSLPAGILFDPRTGSISGTVPENLDKLDITIKAVNPDGTTRILNLKIDLKKLKEANRADAEKYIGLKEQLVAENQKLENYGDYVVSLFA